MDYPGYRSFLVRLWCEVSADGDEQWCSEVEHIQSGSTERFASIDALLAFLRAAATRDEHAPGAPATPGAEAV